MTSHSKGRGGVTMCDVGGRRGGAKCCDITQCTLATAGMHIYAGMVVRLVFAGNNHGLFKGGGL